jgi:hypothetical protein
MANVQASARREFWRKHVGLTPRRSPNSLIAKVGKFAAALRPFPIVKFIAAGL